MALTQALAEFAIGLPSYSLQEPVLARANQALLDTLGVALAGTGEEVSKLARRYVAGLGTVPKATVWGDGLRAAPAEAAFLNGIAAHALDFDDSMPTSRSHPSAPVLPAAFAAAELSDATGREFLAAYAMGLEITGRLGRVLGDTHYLRGWHSTATIGAFAATAAAARLLGLEASDLCRAWGFAASMAGGLVRNFGTSTKAFHVGRAAQIGVNAALLVRDGLTADEGIFDGPGGFLAAYEAQNLEPDVAALTAPNRTWDVLDPGIYVKRWPCCYATHRALGGVLQLVTERQIRTDQIAAVTVGFPPGSDAALIKHLPTTPTEAKFSIEYVLAVGLLDRRVGIASFDAAGLRRSDVREIMPRIRRVNLTGAGVFSGLVGFTDITLELQGGGEIQTRVDRTPGSPVWPPSEAESSDKFRDCAARGIDVGQVERLWEVASRCATLPNVGALGAALAHRSPVTN